MASDDDVPAAGPPGGGADRRATAFGSAAGFAAGSAADAGSGLLRESLRDLVPDYRPPADPFVRVRARVRRRRAHRRVLLAVGSAASVAAIAVTVPAVVDLARPASGRDAAQADAAGAAGSPTGSDSLTGSGTPTGSSSPVRPAPVYPVAHGTIGDAAWSVGSTRLSDQARRCLYADDKVIFDRAAWCFDDWRPGGPVTWAVVDALRPTANVTAVFGVASEPVAWVEVRLSGGAKRQRVNTARTATDPQVRFFALVLPTPGLRVLSVATFAADSSAVDLAVLQPSAGQACGSGPEQVCGQPPP